MLGCALCVPCSKTCAFSASNVKTFNSINGLLGNNGSDTVSSVVRLRKGSWLHGPETRAQFAGREPGRGVSQFKQPDFKLDEHAPTSSSPSGELGHETVCLQDIAPARIMVLAAGHFSEPPQKAASAQRACSTLSHLRKRPVHSVHAAQHRLAQHSIHIYSTAAGALQPALCASTVASTVKVTAKYMAGDGSHCHTSLFVPESCWLRCTVQCTDHLPQCARGLAGGVWHQHSAAPGWFDAQQSTRGKLPVIPIAPCQ